MIRGHMFLIEGEKAKYIKSEVSCGLQWLTVLLWQLQWFKSPCWDQLEPSISSRESSSSSKAQSLKLLGNHWPWDIAGVRWENYLQVGRTVIALSHMTPKVIILLSSIIIMDFDSTSLLDRIAYSDTISKATLKELLESSNKEVWTLKSERDRLW